ncbi:ABC transporter substrate-binding protein [Rhodocytophaga rosea]|uniref:ABC transporter substrate-binding protein n=1 Tax=Rhodocytophaga rosea TaxID=2704465 RepID=A0A6C0GF91_9BACT|nr:helical backbone metal receptor [Rhodocytophaga rosea]QHT66587.1 ABC transporter substrate-binding protein [Rhodocytophaga rosea]
MITSFPQRIISLVPSQTELLFDLGLAERVVGITKFCIHPAEFCRHMPKIGGTKHFHFDTIDGLQPDLILANKEENYKEGIEQLQQKYPVWMSDIYTLEDALHMISEVGKLTGTQSKALEISVQIQTAFAGLQAVSRKKVAYLIWRNPYMAAGSHTFIHDMMVRCGFENVFADHVRYPEITPEMLADANPDYIYLSSEPFPFSEKYIAEFKEICPESIIKIVDGEMFSWYGSRLRLSVPYFRQLLELLA